MSNVCRMPKARDIIIIIVGFVLMFVFSIIAKLIVTALGFSIISDTAVNGEPMLLVLRAVIQLVGEELIKFISLIIVAAYLYKSIGRKTAIIIAIIISQVIFSLNHIPAYGFSILYLIITIGISSLILPFYYCI